MAWTHSHGGSVAELKVDDLGNHEYNVGKATINHPWLGMVEKATYRHGDLGYGLWHSFSHIDIIGSMTYIIRSILYYDHYFFFSIIETVSLL